MTDNGGNSFLSFLNVFHFQTPVSDLQFFSNKEEVFIVLEILQNKNERDESEELTGCLLTKTPNIVKKTLICTSQRSKYHL